MKNSAHFTSSNVPSSVEVINVISRLEQPFRALAWLMLETGARFNELQSLRVRDLQSAGCRIHVGSEQGIRALDISRGLSESLNDYIETILRPAFEQMKRWTAKDRSSAAPLFSRQLLFPVWILDGYERAQNDEAIPADEFACSLRHAAMGSGCRASMHSNTMRLVAAKSWLAMGVSMDELHASLGHRDLMTTMLLAEALQRGKLTFAAAA